MCGSSTGDTSNNLLEQMLDCEKMLRASFLPPTADIASAVNTKMTVMSTGENCRSKEASNVPLPRDFTLTDRRHKKSFDTKMFLKRVDTNVAFLFLFVFAKEQTTENSKPRTSTVTSPE